MDVEGVGICFDCNGKLLAVHDFWNVHMPSVSCVSPAQGSLLAQSACNKHVIRLSLSAACQHCQPLN